MNPNRERGAGGHRRLDQSSSQGLVLTEGTVTNHVERILRRLQLKNQVQVAAWATARDIEAGLSCDGGAR